MAPARVSHFLAEPLKPVSFTAVKIESPFWSPKLAVSREKTLWHNFRMCDATHRIRNFECAAGAEPRKFEGYFFNDSDVYKAVEAAAYWLALEPDPKLDEYVDGLIAKFAAAQQPDGYLNTYFTLNPDQKRWSKESDMHETYCAGHLIEAAVAHHRATGKRNFLDIAIRLADHLDSVFGPEKLRDVPGHQQTEIALVKLYEVTKEPRYLKLAKFYIDQRGDKTRGKLFGEYCQDHLPVREQREVVGHAVRAMYLYCGMADVAVATGDTTLLQPLPLLWEDLTQKKMYVTGGIGNSSKNEGFTGPYDLPNDNAYAESCASIGLALWAHRMTQLTGDSKYADVFERVLYNGFLSSVSLDGEKFFYTNPLADKGKARRPAWHACACCPPNIARFMPQLGGFAYSTAKIAGGPGLPTETIYVHHFLAGRAEIDLFGKKVVVTQSTQYPWDGKVSITVEPEKPDTYVTLAIRIPGWCRGAKVLRGLDGQPQEGATIPPGYFTDGKLLKGSATIELELPMPPERIESNPNVKGNIGRVAIQRGPIVYCVEHADNKGRARNLVLARSIPLNTAVAPDLLGGVTLIRGVGLRSVEDPTEEALYSRAADLQPASITAIPYFAWCNREPGEMVVWIPETPTVLERPVMPGVTPSASHCFFSDTPDALCDRIAPKSSSDEDVPRLTWWDHRGTKEWAQLDFARPRFVSSVELYWFDDTGKGNCRVPASWKLLYKAGGEWREVSSPSAYGVAKDQFNRTTFEPVTAEGLRVEVQLQDNVSGGILEWKFGLN